MIDNGQLIIDNLGVAFGPRFTLQSFCLSPRAQSRGFYVNKTDFRCNR